MMIVVAVLSIALAWYGMIFLANLSDLMLEGATK